MQKRSSSPSLGPPTGPAPAHAAAPERHLELWRALAALVHALFQIFGEPQQIAARGALAAKTRAHLLIWLRAGEAVLRHLLLIDASALVSGAPSSSRQAAPSRRADGRQPAIPAQADEPRDPRQRRRIVHHPDAPEAWRVSFRCFPRLRRQRSSARGVRAPPEKLSDAYRYDFIDPENLRTWKEDRARWLREFSAHTAAPSVSFADTSPVTGGRNPAPAYYSPWPLAERAEALLRAYNNPAPHARRLAQRLRARPDQARRLFYIPYDADRAIDRPTLLKISAAGQHAARLFDTS